jgi:murein DD-endopeptidase MepM/ murein hydrolase activator NlpD
MHASYLHWLAPALGAAAIAAAVVLADTGRVSAGINTPWQDGRTAMISSGYDGALHTGVADFGLDFNWYGEDRSGSSDADCGEPVVAGSAGQVRLATCSGRAADSGYGCHVEVAHSGTNGPRSYHAHLQNNLRVQRLERVCRGAVLGYVGKTGGQATCHLHFHMTTDGRRAPLSPEPLIGIREPQPQGPGWICAGHLGLSSGDWFKSCIGWDNCPGQPRAR